MGISERSFVKLKHCAEEHNSPDPGPLAWWRTKRKAVRSTFSFCSNCFFFARGRGALVGCQKMTLKPNQNDVFSLLHKNTARQEPPLAM